MPSSLRCWQQHGSGKAQHESVLHSMATDRLLAKQTSKQHARKQASIYLYISLYLSLSLSTSLSTSLSLYLLSTFSLPSLCLSLSLNLLSTSLKPIHPLCVETLRRYLASYLMEFGLQESDLGDKSLFCLQSLSCTQQAFQNEKPRRMVPSIMELEALRVRVLNRVCVCASLSV